MENVIKNIEKLDNSDKRLKNALYYLIKKCNMAQYGRKGIIMKKYKKI